MEEKAKALPPSKNRTKEGDPAGLSRREAANAQGFFFFSVVFGSSSSTLPSFLLQLLLLGLAGFLEGGRRTLFHYYFLLSGLLSVLHDGSEVKHVTVEPEDCGT